MTKASDILKQNVSEIRIAIGLSQEDFSKICDFSRTTLTNIENAKSLPSVDTLNKISKFTTISLEKLTKASFKPPQTLRESLQKKYKNDPEKSVLLEGTPSLPYIIKYKLLPSGFLNDFKSRKQIVDHVSSEYKWQISPNTLSTSLRRHKDLIDRIKNPETKTGFLYKKI